MNSTDILKKVLEMSNYGMERGRTNTSEIQMLYIDLAIQMNVPLERIESNVITTDAVYKEPRGLAVVGDYFNQAKERQNINQGMTR